MLNSNSLGSTIVAQDLRVNTLLEYATIVGGIYTMGYEDVLVLTNDLWKKQAGGVPQHCFLLATAIEPDSAPDADDEEVILLRVTGPAPLPAEGELVQVRAEAMREMVTARGNAGAISSPAIIDVLTRNEIQFSALRAKVLGTFYEKQVASNSILSLGSDIETYYSASRYKVYKPYGKSLEIIASYPEITEDEERQRQEGGPIPQRIRIGSVRYSSTIRRRAASENTVENTAVPVAVNIKDFVSMKTAILGMTRLGKSNTMKTIATSVFQYAMETSEKIGQLLFDPAGEYANVTQQDKTALSELGADYVKVFRYGADGQTPGVSAISTNFFSNALISETWSIVSSYLSSNNTNIRYIDNFLSANVVGPNTLADNPSLYNRAARKRAVFYASLIKAGFEVPTNFQTSFVVNANVLGAVNQNKARNSIADFQTSANGTIYLNQQQLLDWCDSLNKAKDVVKNVDDAWIDSELEALLVIYTVGAGAGYRILAPLKVFHSLDRDTDYCQEILTDLDAGKIVIIDMSRGSEDILRYCSERIINYILADATQRFAAGENPRKIQIFLEEAHRLFNRDNMKIKADADPYVRLAKEAAKFEIGLIYATQEVSSVDPLILSNTSNWIITHLNNHSEVRELSKYYDFEDFADITMKAEDVGFARMKTRSGRYIIPVQIDKFDQSRIDAALVAANAAQGGA